VGAIRSGRERYAQGAGEYGSAPGVTFVQGTVIKLDPISGCKPVTAPQARERLVSQAGGPRQSGYSFGSSDGTSRIR
jgi:hypothetical protein